jgi:hypothetical protein
MVKLKLHDNTALSNVPETLPPNIRSYTKVDAVDHYLKQLWPDPEFRALCDKIDDNESFTGKWTSDRLLAAIMIKQAAEDAGDDIFADDKPIAIRYWLFWALDRHELSRSQLLTNRSMKKAAE